MESLLTPGAIPPGIAVFVLYFVLSGRIKNSEMQITELKKDIETARSENQSAAIQLATLNAKMDGLQNAVEGLDSKFDKRNEMLALLIQESARGNQGL